MNNETTIIESNAIAAMASKGVKIAGDVVNKATQDLPDNQRSAIRRLHAYYIENDLSLAETAKLLGFSEAVPGLVFRGKYDASLDQFVKEVENFFTLMDKRSQGRKLDFITTSLTEKIFKVCDAAVEFQRIAFIFGDMQIGKTAALEQYQRTHNHGSTVYVRMPTGGAQMHFMMELARKLRISDNLSIPKMRERIIAAFDDRMLLIVDEAHQCIPDSGNSKLPVKSIEFIREIFDAKQCGVVICATNVFRDSMDEGPVEKILRQTKRRRLCALQLPNTPTQADLNTFSAGYGLPASHGAARKLEAEMVEAEALGMWLTLLRMGAKIAAQRNQKINWNHVISAHAGLKELEGEKF